MWKEDWLTKSKREEMETALQIERNKEMTDVSVILVNTCDPAGLLTCTFILATESVNSCKAKRKGK